MRGLKLTFRHEGGWLATDVRLGRDYESFPGIIHGGIIATVLDEVMARASLLAHRMPAMTVGLRLRYVRAMKSGHPHVATAEVLSRDGELVRIQGRLESLQEGLVAVADATFILLDSDQLATARHSLPADTIESFKQYMQGVNE